MAWQNRIPVIGGFLDNPEQEALTQRFNDMASAYQNYRGLHADARQQGLGAQLGMFGPVQEYLSLMMPGISPFDTQGAQARLGNVAFNMQAGPSQGVTGGAGPAGVVGGTAAPPAVASAPGQVNVAGDAEWDPVRQRWAPRTNV